MQPGLVETFELGTDGALHPVRRFNSARIQSAIDGALASVTSNSAVLKFEKTAEGWNAAVAAKVNGNWTIAAAYTREEWGNSIGASVKYEW